MTYKPNGLVRLQPSGYDQVIVSYRNGKQTTVKSGQVAALPVAELEGFNDKTRESDFLSFVDGPVTGGDNTVAATEALLLVF